MPWIVPDTFAGDSTLSWTKLRTVLDSMLGAALSLEGTDIDNDAVEPCHLAESRGASTVKLFFVQNNGNHSGQALTTLNGLANAGDQFWMANAIEDVQTTEFPLEQSVGSLPLWERGRITGVRVSHSGYMRASINSGTTAWVLEQRASSPSDEDKILPPPTYLDLYLKKDDVSGDEEEEAGLIGSFLLTDDQHEALEPLEESGEADQILLNIFAGDNLSFDADNLPAGSQGMNIGEFGANAVLDFRLRTVATEQSVSKWQAGSAYQFAGIAFMWIAVELNLLFEPYERPA